MSENKAGKALAFLSLGLAPFLAVFFETLRKGPNEPVLMKHLLVVFGIFFAVCVALAVKIFFFSHVVLTLG